MRPYDLTSSLPIAVCGQTPSEGAGGDEVAFCAAAGLALDDGGKPIEWVQLLPMGVFRARDGRKPWFVKDKAHASAIVAASKGYAGSTDLVIDYDHQSEAALKDHSIKAPASGWIKELQVRDDGIYGRVEWTPAAAAHLAAKEYRYISPVFAHEKHDEAGSPARVLGLMRAGLTNNPALPELAAVAAHDPSIKDSGMTLLQKLLKALGLPETTTEEQAVTALASVVTAASGLKTIAVAAGLPETSDAVAICAAVKSAGEAEPDATKYVPIQMFKDLQTQVASLQTSGVEKDATAAVDAAIAALKIPRAQRDFWLKNAKGDLAGFNAHVATLAALPGAPGDEDRRQRVDPATVTLTAEEKAMCSQFGWDAERFLADKKEELAR